MGVRRFVILVAGHDIDGDPGAVAQGTKENVEVVRIVDMAYDMLVPHPDITVVKVPHELDFVDSTNWINDNYKNLDDGVIVEVHKNSHTSAATGIETFTGIGPDAITLDLAKKVNDNQVAITGLANRGVKQGGFYLITYTNQRAILTESGFINNDPVGEEANKKYATGIVNGVCDFFGVSKPSAAAPQPVPKPVPNPTPVTQVLFHVFVDNKQVGVYAVEKNAYAKWHISGRTGSVRDGAGNDITEALKAKYDTIIPAPQPTIKPTVLQPGIYEVK